MGKYKLNNFYFKYATARAIKIPIYKNLWQVTEILLKKNQQS